MVDTYELLYTDHHAVGHPQGNVSTPKMNAHTGLLLRSNCNMPTHAGRHVHGSFKNQYLPQHSAINQLDNTNLTALGRQSA